MALKAPQGNGGGKQFAPQENIKPGTYPSRVVQLIDFGLQPQRPYMGQEKKPAYELGITYELVDEFMKDEQGEDIEDKPRWISETLPVHPLVADKAKSTQRYNTFDPNMVHGGDFVAAMLSNPCNVTIVNNKSGDKVYDNVATTSAMRQRDADKCPELKNPAKVFDLDQPDLAVFNSFPKWIQEKIQGNLNYKGSKLEKLLGGKAVAPKEEPPFEPDMPAPGIEDQSNNPY